MGTCINGHTNATGNTFCEICGVVLTSDSSTAQESASSFFGASDSSIGQVPGMPSKPKRSKLRWLIPLVAGILILVAGGIFFATKGKGNVPFVPQTTTVTVNLMLFNSEGCTLGIGYMDVPGSAVSISADGKVVGMSKLSEYGDELSASCTFTAKVPDVPMNASVYDIEIGRRGNVTVTKSELSSTNWTYTASLGL